MLSNDDVSRGRSPGDNIIPASHEQNRHQNLIFKDFVAKTIFTALADFMALFLCFRLKFLSNSSFDLRDLYADKMRGKVGNSEWDANVTMHCIPY